MRWLLFVINVVVWLRLCPVSDYLVSLDLHPMKPVQSSSITNYSHLVAHVRKYGALACVSRLFRYISFTQVKHMAHGSYGGYKREVISVPSKKILH